MNVEEIARQHEIARGLEERSEAWTRKDGSLKKKGLRFYQQPTFQRYVLWAALGIATAAFCSYVGYKVVNSGASIIERRIDDISVFYLDE